MNALTYTFCFLASYPVSRVPLGIRVVPVLTDSSVPFAGFVVPNFSARFLFFSSSTANFSFISLNSLALPLAVIDDLRSKLSL